MRYGTIFTFFPWEDTVIRGWTEEEIRRKGCQEKGLPGEKNGGFCFVANTGPGVLILSECFMRLEERGLAWMLLPRK